MSNQHTPGKWEVLDGRRVSVGLPSLTEGCGYDSHCVALTHDSQGRLDAEANARRIVQCVNAHDGLVAALQEVLTRIVPGSLASEVRQRAEAALSKATGES